MIAIEVAGQSVEVSLTRHAIERWQERIQPGVSMVLAESQIHAFMAGGKLTGRAPKWLLERRWPAADGYRFAMNSTWPKVALVVADNGTVVSVLLGERRPRLLKRPNRHHDLDRRRP